MEKKPRVVIVGAGFAGLYAAKALKWAPVDVLMIDQHNYHTFQPLLYQVATAQLEPDEIAHTVRGTFQGFWNFNFRQGTVTGVDWDQKEVLLADGDAVGFDYLIVAAGAVYNDFGIEGVKEHGYFLKSLSESVNIRSHMLRQFERASADPSLIDEGILNFVIVGGGPTGVEMAGAMTELFDKVLPEDYPNIDLNRAKVILVEMLDGLLPPFSKKTQKYTQRVLENRGVEVRLGTTVSEVRAHEVELKSGEVIPSETLLWAAGIRASPLVEALGVELTKGYRVAVADDLSLPDRPYAFMAGDMSGAMDGKGRLYPQVAQVAIQQGKHAAKQIQAIIKGEPTDPFEYFDKGIMAIIGRNAGVAELSKVFLGMRFRGFLGWLSWLFIHLVYLPGHQNRVNALANWAYSYFTFDRHSRLITDMEPSPAEITDKTGKLVSDVYIAQQRESDALLRRLDEKPKERLIVNPRKAAEPEKAGTRERQPAVTVASR